MAFDLKQFQREHLEWSLRNFGNQPAVNPLLGVVEEVGELSHAFLKQQQGIRNAENLRAKEIDAVADIVIFLTDYCNRRSIDLDAALEATWTQVKARDWKANPDTAHQIAENPSTN